MAVGSAPPAPPADLSVSRPPPPPGSPGLTDDADLVDLPPELLQAEVERLRQRVRRRRRRGLLLAAAALAAAALGLGCLGTYYATSVLSYARLDALRLERDPDDAQRLVLVYEPASAGTLGFSRAVGDRETELVDRVLPDEVGASQRFQWRVKGVKAGETINVTSLAGWRLRTTALVVPALTGSDRGAGGAAEVALGAGVLAGRIVNAIDNTPVAGATVRIPGTHLSTQTDADGAFRIADAPRGTVPVEVTAEGFTTEQIERTLTAGENRPVHLALNPGMEKGQMRIVLLWENPSQDLDAHLEGPLPDDQRFHVYYHQQGDLLSREFVRLDVDARKGGAPETITVLGVLPGTYRYFVHDYTHRDDPQSTALSRSGAEVKVYQGGQTYRFRAAGPTAGNIWDVCTIDVTPDGAEVRKVDQYRGAKVESLGLYAKRTLADREQWIGQYGGSVISEKAVNEGLEWLARHQMRDGSWSPRSLGEGPQSRCEKPDWCTGPGDDYEMALTGLAVLAFQAGGHYYFNESKHSGTVRRGLDWIVAHQGPDGVLVGSKDKGTYPFPYHKYYMYEHGIASFALADACAAALALGQPENDAYVRATEKAVRFIEANQHNDGGWRYTPDVKRPGDSSVTGWQVLALKSAREAGIAVSEPCIARIRKFFEYRASGENGRTGYLDRIPSTDATTGVGMLARQFLLGEPDAPLIHEAAAYLADLAEMQWGDRKAEENRDYYLWYNCTLAMFQVGGEYWERWNSLVRDTIVGLQCHAGCERGSWDPNDTRWGEFGGRIYTTALAVLTLETYYRYTPHDEMGTDTIGPNRAAGSQSEPVGRRRWRGRAAGLRSGEPAGALRLQERGDE
jgi:uncharacterized protein YfaP (DUF2135 family)